MMRGRSKEAQRRRNRKTARDTRRVVRRISSNLRRTLNGVTDEELAKTLRSTVQHAQHLRAGEVDNITVVELTRIARKHKVSLIALIKGA
jgi:hypothetical protein